MKKILGSRLPRHFSTAFTFIALTLTVGLFLGCIKKEKAKTSSGPQDKAFAALDSSKLIGEFDPLASPLAQPGGTYTTWGSEYPKSLNYFLSLSSTSKQILDFLFEPLVTLHTLENKPTGILAESWEETVPGMTFRFKIRPEAKWSDGKNITARDFQFYYDVIMNPKHLTSVFRVGLSRFSRPLIIDSLTLEIQAKEPHWSNFYEAGGLVAFPEHIWKDLDFNTINEEFPVVSGPYQISKLKAPRMLVLSRRNDWWGRKLAYNAGKYNFSQIKYEFMEDRNKALEAFFKGEFDLYPVYTASIWAKKTQTDVVQKGWVARQEIYNREPKGFQGLALNMRRPQFSDLKVRQALALLLNREIMNEKLMHNQYFLLNSYFPDLYPQLQNPQIKLTPFNPDSARKLLAEAGYKAGADGILKRQGKRLSITLLSASSDQRHMNIYMEDLKKVGIHITLEELSLASLQRRLDNFDYDMYWMAWGASRLRDPEAAWHSKYSQQTGSNNLTGLQDPMVDSLITLMKNEANLVQRDNLLRQLDTRLASLQPYVLLWQSGYHRVLYWNHFGTLTSVYDKYNREDAVPVYWWQTVEQREKLQKARQNNTTLPLLPPVVRYQE